jgi:YD repeat-containing protein
MAHAAIDHRLEIAGSRASIAALSAPPRANLRATLEDAVAGGTAPKSFDRVRLRKASVGAAAGVVAIVILLAFAPRVQADITYTYDNVGRLTSVTDALGNMRNYTYDAAGNLISITTPSGQQSAFSSEASFSEPVVPSADGAPAAAPGPPPDLKLPPPPVFEPAEPADGGSGSTTD